MVTTTWKLTDPAIVRVNQKGQITPAQRTALQGLRLEIPSWKFLGSVLGLSVGLLGITLFLANQFAAPLAEPLAVVLNVGGIGGFVVWFYGTSWLRARAAVAEATAGAIAQGLGEVRWHQGAYHAYLDGQKLHTVTLAPGPYRFYWLPRAQVVLSAEALPFPKAERQAQIAAALAEVFHADAATVAANQAGQLTVTQRGRLALRGGLWGGGSLIAWRLALAALESTARDWAAWFLVGVLVLVGGLCGWMAWQRLADAARRVAQCTTGPATAQAQVGARSVTYTYRVRGQVFHVSAAAYCALLAGTYQVYYAPTSKTVVSVVPVEGAARSRKAED